MILLLESELNKEKTSKIEECKQKHNLRIRETELIEKENILKNENSLL